MKISDNGLKLLKQFEGFRSTMYFDSANLPTIGFGTLIDAKEELYLLKAEITEEEGEELLKKDLAPVELFVSKVVRPVISPNEFDALCCFAYNVGRGALASSTLLKKVNLNPMDPSIRAEFLKWNKARVDGKLVVVNGLSKRRKAEANLYFS